MPDDDHGLLLPHRHRVLHVFRPFPFAGFSGHKNIHLRQGPHHGLQRCGTCIHGTSGDFHGRVTQHPHGAKFQPVLQIFRHGTQRGGGHIVERLGGVCLRPAQRPGQARYGGVRLAGVPVIVEAPDHQTVLCDQIGLVAIDRVVRKILRAVAIAPEGGFVGDDQIPAGLHGLLQNGNRGHHGGGDAAHGRIRAARFEDVAGGRLPRHAQVALNAFDDLLSGECSGLGRSLLRHLLSGRHGQRKPSSCEFHTAIIQACITI